MEMRLDEQVAIVTGAGQGLGRSHALALAERGAKVVVNDLGDTNGRSEPARSVVTEIRAAGGHAIANGANVADFEEVERLFDQAMAEWGRVDILLNNAGILRDKSFAKMSMDEFRAVIDVHLLGSAHCAKAVWAQMRKQRSGRIIFTTSGSGLYGNFGQANYAAAKMAMLGLMNTLDIEGEKYDIRVNCLAPTAGTAMMEGLVPDDVFAVLTPESVSQGAVFLAGSDAPRRTVLCAGGGCFAVYKGFETTGIALQPGENTAEQIQLSWDLINSAEGMAALQGAFEQTERFARRQLGGSSK